MGAIWGIGAIWGLDGPICEASCGFPNSSGLVIWEVGWFPMCDCGLRRWEDEGRMVGSGSIDSAPGTGGPWICVIEELLSSWPVIPEMPPNPSTFLGGDGFFNAELKISMLNSW